MGFEVFRFQAEVDEELLCPICAGVLEEPVQGNRCEHAFCRNCIREWLHRQCTCPVDRKELCISDLRPVPRILRNMLSRLTLTCDNLEHGCQQIVKLDRLNAHLQECVYNPERPLPCSKGCGCIMKPIEMNEHNCLRELRIIINKQDKKITELKCDLQTFQTGYNELKRQMQQTRELLQAMRTPISYSTPRTDPDDIVQWGRNIPRARVLRWGGMISTPDESLQFVIRRILSEYSCPPDILEALMQNCHEQHWPRGLSSLESRQLNRHLFDTYICRRIPHNQSILILACDNEHMPDDLTTDPGLIMIFAHGIIDM